MTNKTTQEKLVRIADPDEDGIDKQMFGSIFYQVVCTCYSIVSSIARNPSTLNQNFVSEDARPYFNNKP